MHHAVESSWLEASREAVDSFVAILRASALAISASALAACSSAYEVAPQPSAAMAPVVPAVQTSARDIVVPMPLPVSLPTGSPQQAERRKGEFKVGKPYEVAGNWYYPAAGTGYDEQGIASWYGPDFHGKSTANGEIYNMDRLTAAHPTLPMPCYVSVTNLDNGRSIVVRVNDRGPYKAGRIIDLSYRAGQLLAMTHSGTANVRVRYIKMAPLMADEHFEQQFLERQPWYRGSTFSLNQPTGGGQVALASTLLRPATLPLGWQPDDAGGR